MIRLIVSDIDGVWTDGGILYSADGTEAKVFNVRDGLGVKLAQKAGIAVAILTSRTSEAVERRCRELGIEEVIQGSRGKLGDLRALSARLQIPLEDICFIGDDLPDIASMKACGCSAAPSDAALDVLAIAEWRLDSPGGRGAFRELVEKILQERGAWRSVLNDLLKE